MTSVSITWRSSHDDRVCPICKAIDGYTWTFDNEVPDSLVHPAYGEIWNVVTGSLAHEQQQFGKKYGLLSNCRCHVDSKVDFKELLDELHKAIDKLKQSVEEIPDTKTGGTRSTTFEDIGVDPSKYGLE